MRTLFIAALLSLSIAGTAAASPIKKFNSAVLASFKIDFAKASNTTWTSGTDYLKASFVLDNKFREAFYNLKGDLIATSENISLDDLPVDAKRSFAKAYGSYEVTQAIKYESPDEEAYYLSAENGKESIIVKVAANSQLSVFKRTKK